jgi:hypothetical protein
MPPQSNATVTAIAGAGTAPDWEEPGTAGAAKWAGSARAYYREATDRSASDGGGVDVNLRRELILDTADLEAMGLDTDDVVTFTVDGEDPTTGKAQVIRKAKLAGIPRGLQTSKITLEAA